MNAHRWHPVLRAGGLAIALAIVATPVYAQRPATAVRVDPVVEEPLQPRRLVTGDLRAAHRSRVATRDGGLVVSRGVEVGEIVGKGDVLARLDPRRLEIELRRSRADERAAVAVQQERQTMREQRERDLELLRASFERGAANPRELRDAESAVAVAEARFGQATQAIDVIREDVALLEQKIADTAVRAPFDGVIVAALLDSGEWASEGAAVVDLLSVDPIEAWLNVPQGLLGSVTAPEVQIPISVEATNTVVLAGNLRVVPNVDPRARSFTLVSHLPNAARAFAPGMSVTAWIPVGERRLHRTVSRNAVLRNDAGPFVYVVRGGGGSPEIAVPVGVEVLFPVGDRVAVRAAALVAGDRVIVEGNERLFPMMPVRPVGEEEEETVADGAAPGTDADAGTTAGAARAEVAP